MPKAKSVNKVILVGNVGQDPEVKYTASGVAVAKLNVATNERFKDKNGQWQDRTEWHSVTVFLPTPRDNSFCYDSVIERVLPAIKCQCDVANTSVLPIPPGEMTIYKSDGHFAGHAVASPLTFNQVPFRGEDRRCLCPAKARIHRRIRMGTKGIFRFALVMVPAILQRRG